MQRQRNKRPLYPPYSKQSLNMIAFIVLREMIREMQMSPFEYAEHVYALEMKERLIQVCVDAEEAVDREFPWNTSKFLNLHSV